MAEEGAPMILRMSPETYDDTLQQLPELYDWSYEVSDRRAAGTVIHNVLTVALFSSLRDVIRREEPDVVVSPYPLYSSMSSPDKRRATPTM